MAGRRAIIGEQSPRKETCHCEGVKRPWQSHNIIKPHPNPLFRPLPQYLLNFNIFEQEFPKERGNKTILSPRGRGDDINSLKRTYSPIDLLTYSLKKKLAAFTLAEVLITLGIIGVVAAMTLPALITNHKKKVLPVRLQKFYSTFNNALEMSQAYNGDMAGWNFPTQADGNSGSNEANYKFFDTYIFPYMKGITKCPPGTNSVCFVELNFDSATSSPVASSYSRYIFADGSCFGVLIGGRNDNFAYLHGWLDYNCKGKPNKAGRDQFVFYMRFALNRADYIPFQYISFEDSQHKVLSDMDREEVKELCKNSPSSCAGLIQYDGWQIKDDYPGKI